MRQTRPSIRLTMGALQLGFKWVGFHLAQSGQSILKELLLLLLFLVKVLKELYLNVQGLNKKKKSIS